MNTRSMKTARMTMLRRRAAISVMLVSAVLSAAADTAGEGTFGEGFGSGFANELQTAGSAAGAAVRGSLSFTARVFPDIDDPVSSQVEADPRLDLAIASENDHGAFSAELAFDSALQGAGAIPIASGVNVSPSPVPYLDRMIREASLRMFIGPVTVETGLLRRVWGKGDELHVVDVLNSTDYSDPAAADYLDSRIAAPMLVVETTFRRQALLEVAYLPVLVPDIVPAEGRWAPAEYAQMRSVATAGVTIVEPPSGTTLGDGQIGVRLADTFGPVDLGLIYYYGYLKQPSVDRTAFIPVPFPAGAISMHYDRVHVAGTEAATAAGPFTFRGEAAFYLTPDTDGTGPAIANPSLRYLAGFDVGLPVSNMRLNAQVLGSIVLHADEIDANGPVDFQYEENGIYTSNLIAASLRDTWFGERLDVELAGAWYVETADFVIRPALTFTFGDVLNLRIGGTVFNGEHDTLLGQYDGNDLLEVQASYEF